MYRVVDDSSNKILGEFYLDPFIRDDKGYTGGNGGHYFPITNKSQIVGKNPLGAMIFSLPVAAFGRPSLLNFEEVEAVFRVFGQCLSHILVDSQWSEFSSLENLEVDAKDIVPNFMVNWLSVPKVIASVSGHWSTNQPLAEDLADKLSTSKHHMAGLELCTELFKTAYDIEYYSSKVNESYEDIEQRLRPQYLLIPKIEEDAFPKYFTEIMDDECPGGYYGRTWAKMLAADAFYAFKEIGLDNENEIKKVGKRFRSTFLESGAKVPTAEIFRQFRGRDPSSEALLISLGLKDITQPKNRSKVEE